MISEFLDILNNDLPYDHYQISIRRIKLSIPVFLDLYRPPRLLTGLYDLLPVPDLDPTSWGLGV